MQADRVTPAQRGEVPTLLFRRAVLPYGHHRAPQVRAQREHQPAVSASVPERLERGRGGHAVGAGSSKFVWGRKATEPQFGTSPPSFGPELALVITLPECVVIEPRRREPPDFVGELSLFL
jgi:hypothetical protein